MAFKKHSLFFAFVISSFLIPFCNAKEQLQEPQISIIDTKQDVTKPDVTQQEKKHVPNSWDKVSALYLPSLVENKEKKEVLTQLNRIRNKTTNQPIKESAETESEKLKKALTPNSTDYIGQVLAYLSTQESAATNLHDESKAIFDDTTYRDLNVFCGKEETSAISLFNLIDNTQTISGRAALLDILYNPLIDTQSLMARQKVIKDLIEDNQLNASIQEKLITIKNAEHTLFLMLNEMHFEKFQNTFI